MLEPSVRSPFHVACESDATVLITGPTGSGKTRMARLIHDSSSRRDRPFVTVNLASLHEGTLESELFGHERGAFTGADSRRAGKLEGADGGTVFLDEIGELSPRLQARLLEFLQTRAICSVGGNRERRLDVRVIAATHRDLRQSIRDGSFREDLFHRLRVVSLRLPSLAEQADRFDQILHECLEDCARSLGRSVRGLTEATASLLESYDWPGNYRELRHALEFAVLACDSGLIEPGHLPDWIHEEASLRRNLPPKPGGDPLGVADLLLASSYPRAMTEFERNYLDHALRRFSGRINRTAREIGISKPTLIRRMRAFGLDAHLPLYREAAPAGGQPLEFRP